MKTFSEWTKHLYDFVASVEDHKIEVTGEPEIPEKLHYYDEEKKVTRFIFRFEVPWNEVCPGCGKIVPHDAYHWMNDYWCIES